MRASRPCGPDRAEKVDEGLVRLPGLGREPREPASEVAAVERRAGVHLPREEAPPERAERDEADPELLERRHHLRFGFSRPQRVLALERGDGLDHVRAADGLRRRLREAEVFDLALLDQIEDGARDVLDRHIRVDTVLIEQIDRLDAQPSQRSIRDLSDVLGPAVHADLFAFAGQVEREPELRGDHHPVADRTERLAHELLVHERAYASAVSKNVTPRSTADRRSEIIARWSGDGP